MSGEFRNSIQKHRLSAFIMYNHSMKITLITIGKIKKDPIKGLYEDYMKRLPWKLQVIELEEKKQFVSPQRKEKEGELILQAIPEGAKVIALDEKGKDLTSPAFAKKIQDWQTHGTSHLVFIIGGADGLSQAVKDKADLMLCLGQMTWPHKMVRLLIIEQLYRAHTILTGHPYHKE